MNNDYRRRSRRRSSRRRGWRAYFAPFMAILAVVVAGLVYVWTSEPDPVPPQAAGPGPSRGAPSERTAALPPLRLPADDAPHGSGMEWWYYNGILDAKTGARYAFHVAVFVANGLVKHTVTHVALTDLQTGKRYAGQRRTGGAPAKSLADGFDLQQDGWRVAVSGASHSLRADFDGVSVALDLSDPREAVAHRADGSQTPGLLDFGASGISYYYSRPRMAAKGEVAVAGQPVQVGGDVWFDHQWGDFDVLSLGWNWFALHLADGSDLMLYQLFDAKGKDVMTAGTLSSAKGVVPLKPGEIELTPGATWTSPKTRINYPVEWRLKLPVGVLEVKPFFPDAEFDSSETSSNIYWEGAVKATGSTSGEGFLELSGYDRLGVAGRPAR